MNKQTNDPFLKEAAILARIGKHKTKQSRTKKKKRKKERKTPKTKENHKCTK
jgi:hypothetical protein